MKKTKILVGFVLVIFLMGILPAGFLPHFGTITGTITILPAEESKINVPVAMDDCKKEGWESLTTLNGRFF